MHITENEILNEVICEYSRLATNFYSKKRWDEMTENELWQELCLCILSSNVPYELARSAFFHLMEKGYLQLDWVASVSNSQRLIANELAKPVYLPKRFDGSFRRYRFPNSRSKNILQAAKVVSSDNGWLSKLLANSSSEEEARDLLVAHIPGFGLKEASHFLRNIRYSHQLAIIDTHVLSFLIKIGAVAQTEVGTITPKTYIKLERKLQEICRKYRLNLSVFDMAIWHYTRRKQ